MSSASSHADPARASTTASTFHRVIDGFMAQTGDPDRHRHGRLAICPTSQAEFSRDAFRPRALSAWRRARAIRTASNSQFFITFADGSASSNGQYTVSSARSSPAWSFVEQHQEAADAASQWRNDRPRSHDPGARRCQNPLTIPFQREQEASDGRHQRPREHASSSKPPRVKRGRRRCDRTWRPTTLTHIKKLVARGFLRRDRLPPRHRRLHGPDRLPAPAPAPAARSTRT